MCVTIRVTPGQALPQRPLKLRRLAVGLVQQQRIAHLQVQFQPPLPVLLVNADAVGAQAVAGGQQADDRGDVLLSGGDRLDVNHHVGVGQDRVHGALRPRGRCRAPARRRRRGPRRASRRRRSPARCGAAASRVTSSTPGTCSSGARRLAPASPCGTLSSRSSTDFLPSFRLTQMTITATPKAATASA